MTLGLFLLCPLSWDWAPLQTLTILPSPPHPKTPGLKGLFTFPKSVRPSAGLSIWHRPGGAGQWVVSGVGRSWWLACWKTGRGIASSPRCCHLLLPQDVACDCPPHPWGAVTGGSHRSLGDTTHTPFLAKAIWRPPTSK